jgi:hypothetical protein
VQLPTGGILKIFRQPASAFSTGRRVSRSGEMPEPTVTVRMKENEAACPPGEPGEPFVSRVLRVASRAPVGRCLSFTP